jgi:adenylate cyclase
MRIPKFGPVTTDNLGRIWIDWSQTTRSYGLTNLPKDFNQAIVVVGPTAAGISNPVPTAIGAVWPHELQAAVITTMANGVVIQRPDYADGLEILTLVLVGVILLFLTRWTYAGIASVIGFVAVFAYGSYFVFNNSLWLFDITGPITGVVLVALHAYGVKFVSEFLQKQQIKKQFGTYLSPDLVAQLQRNPELLVLGGDSRELSIMFTDVRGFTTISEHYGQDVQGLTRIMNRYMTAMTKKILENKGTLDKYIGDAQMAFWNAPLDNTQHAKDAVRTALQMMESLDEFNREVTAEGVPAFGMGLGINTGTVVVGNMGSDQRFDYTCLGDSVNLAARLEGQSKNYGVRIVLGTTTAEYVQEEYNIFELDNIAVKGKKEGVTIYTLAHETEQHRQFLTLYYAQSIIPYQSKRYRTYEALFKCWS